MDRLQLELRGIVYLNVILPGGPPAAGDVGPEVLARLGVARRLLEAAVVGEDGLRETVPFIWGYKLSGIGEK